jgi:2-dehydro-3-deoxygluconokinase
MGLLRASDIGSIEHVSDFALHIGGAESNVAIGVARLGHRSAWIGRVGDDGLGRRVLRELRAETVEVHGIVDPAAPTGLMLKESPTAESTRVLYYRAGSAASRFTPADLDAELIASASILHVTGITLAISDTAASTVLAAVRMAVDAGVPVSFDVNHRARLWRDRDPAEQYREIARQSMIVFAGADEAAILVGDGEPAELAQRLVALGPSHAVVKLGAEGSLAVVDGGLHTQRPYPVSALDTVGAGDAFVAGYLAGWLDGSDAPARLDLASRCGAFACLSPGDWEGLPRRADLSALDGGDPVLR